MDGGAGWAAVHGVRPSWVTEHTKACVFSLPPPPGSLPQSSLRSSSWRGAPCATVWTSGSLQKPHVEILPVVIIFRGGALRVASLTRVYHESWMGLRVLPREIPNLSHWDLRWAFPLPCWKPEIWNCDKNMSVLCELLRLWNFITVAQTGWDTCRAPSTARFLGGCEHPFLLGSAWVSCCPIIWRSALPRTPQYLWLLSFLKLLSHFCELP